MGILHRADITPCADGSRHASLIGGRATLAVVDRRAVGQEQKGAGGAAVVVDKGFQLGVGAEQIADAAGVGDATVVAHQVTPARGDGWAITVQAGAAVCGVAAVVKDRVLDRGRAGKVPERTTGVGAIAVEGGVGDGQAVAPHVDAAAATRLVVKDRAVDHRHCADINVEAAAQAGRPVGTDAAVLDSHRTFAVPDAGPFRRVIVDDSRVLDRHRAAVVKDGAAKVAAAVGAQRRVVDDQRAPVKDGAAVARAGIIAGQKAVVDGGAGLGCGNADRRPGKARPVEQADVVERQVGAAKEKEYLPRILAA